MWKKLRRRRKETLPAGVASPLRRMHVYSEVRKTAGQRAAPFIVMLFLPDKEKTQLVKTVEDSK